MKAFASLLLCLLCSTQISKAEYSNPERISVKTAVKVQGSSIISWGFYYKVTPWSVSSECGEVYGYRVWGRDGENKSEIQDNEFVEISGVYNDPDWDNVYWGRGVELLGRFVEVNTQANALFFCNYGQYPQAGVSIGAGGLYVLGSSKADKINGSRYADYLVGLSGNDTIMAGDGADLIYGGAGLDYLTGGAGKDKFIYRSKAESPSGSNKRDQIYDFHLDEDLIDLSRIDANPKLGGFQYFTFIGNQKFSGKPGEIRYQASSPGVAIKINLDTDKLADMEIFIHNLSYLRAKDLKLK